MSKRRDGSDGPPMRPSGPPLGWPQLVTMAGLAVVLFVGIQNWNETRKMQTTLGERFGQVDSRLTQLAVKVEMGARPAPAAQRGPDPNRVYAVKTDGAPTKGPRSAPVVIAEFSDFQ